MPTQSLVFIFCDQCVNIEKGFKFDIVCMLLCVRARVRMCSALVRACVYPALLGKGFYVINGMHIINSTFSKVGVPMVSGL